MAECQVLDAAERRQVSDAAERRQVSDAAERRHAWQGGQRARCRMQQSGGTRDAAAGWSSVLSGRSRECRMEVRVMLCAKGHFCIVLIIARSETG